MPVAPEPPHFGHFTVPLPLHRGHCPTRDLLHVLESGRNQQQQSRASDESRSVGWITPPDGRARRVDDLSGCLDVADRGERAVSNDTARFAPTDGAKEPVLDLAIPLNPPHGGVGPVEDSTARIRPADRRSVPVADTTHEFPWSSAGPASWTAQPLGKVTGAGNQSAFGYPSPSTDRPYPPGGDGLNPIPSVDRVTPRRGWKAPAETWRGYTPKPAGAALDVRRWIFAGRSFPIGRLSRI